MLVSERRKRFRNHLAGDTCIQPATVFDALSARIADTLGFEIGMLPGSVASAAALASPDIAVLTLTELADRARQITRVSDISLLVDADHGYGNALNVARTVQELENAEVSALTIEDTSLPAPFKPETGPKLIPLDEMVGKLKAALDARRDPLLLIIGRTGGLASENLDSVLQRVRVYTDTGVGGIFLTGVKSREQLEAVGKATRLPLLVGGPPPALADLQTLAGLRVKIAIKGHIVLPMVVQAMYDALKSQKDGKPSDSLKDRSASKELMESVLRQKKFADWQKEYLGYSEEK